MTRVKLKFRKFLVAGLLVTLTGYPIHAAALKAVGVLGNSGERGQSLVRFEGESASGVGVVFDMDGTLWSGGGDGQLIRYAVDGRQLATYSTTQFGGKNHADSMTVLNRTLLIKLKDTLQTLSLDTASGGRTDVLELKINRLSDTTFEGWAYASVGPNVFRVNASGETQPVGEASGEVIDLAVGSQGDVYVNVSYKIHPLKNSDHIGEIRGSNFQWSNGYWYAHSYHGTIRRFDHEMKPDPGVVLGGNSGSFIGYVPGNYELNIGQGMTFLGGRVYAVSGNMGILHLLVWQPQELRFAIVRRIGSVTDCDALAMDSEGRVWFHGGVWKWEDGPDAPLEHGIPSAGAESGGGPFAAVMLPSNVLVAVDGNHRGSGLFSTGDLLGPARRSGSEDVPKEGVAAAAVLVKNRQAVLMVDEKGTGTLVHVSSSDGRPQGKVADVQLKASEPLEKLTSLTSDNGLRLWAAANGAVIEFVREGDDWKETRRWNQWGQGESSRFGSQIQLSWGDGRLWVADTDRHRVLVFDADSGKFLTQCGATDKTGKELGSLDTPQTLAVSGRRAVVYDSGNQRIVRLQWSE